jgi:hypothetical protein
MTQGKFGFKREKTIKRATKDFDVANLRCAKEIALNPEEHGGPGSGLNLWAARVIERLEGVGSRPQNAVFGIADMKIRPPAVTDGRSCGDLGRPAGVGGSNRCRFSAP